MRQVERQNHGQSPGQHHGHAYGRVQAHGIHPVQHPHPQHRTAARSDYTLGHGGRQFRLGPVTFWIVVGATVIMAGWSLATGTYFAFKDDVLTRLNFGRAHHRVLHFVDRYPGLTIAELLDILRITKQSLNRVLKDLIGQGYVAVTPLQMAMLAAEIANGGIVRPTGADFDVEPVEVPAIRAFMPGRVKFLVGLANDEVSAKADATAIAEKQPFAVWGSPAFAQMETVLEELKARPDYIA